MCVCVCVCVYACIYLSICALFGKCISQKENLFPFFLIKLMEFSPKN